MSIEVRLVEPGTLPARLAGVAVHAAGVVTFLMRADLTALQMAKWITWLGQRIPDAPGRDSERHPTGDPQSPQ